jgi:DNA polymerase-3 subunit delta'
MSFQDVLGHSKEISILKRAISSGRVPHCYLFAGPEGVGKRLTARAFAKALNCETPAGGINSVEDRVDSCGVCTSCRQIDEGSHLNLVRVEPVLGVLRIDQVRELQNALKYRVESGQRVAIVDGADKLMKGAANAMLKTLEEPPANSIIILITSRPAELLPTILSRCQRVNFRPLPEETVLNVLINTFGEGELATEEAATIARFSGGSLARALEVVRGGEQARRKGFLERFLRLTPGDGDAILGAARDLSKEEDIEEALEFLKTWYRDQVVFNEGAEGLIVTSGVTGGVMGQAGDIGGQGFERLIRSFELVEEARRNITPPRRANKQLTMEVLFFELLGAAAPVT